MPQETPLQILLADDDPIARYAFGKGLRNRGYAVYEAASGAEAISALHKRDFDAAIVDIRMPGVSGHDVAHAASSCRLGILLIALSGYESAEDIQASLDAGFAMHIGKGWTMDPLFEALERLKSERGRGAGAR